MTRLDCTDIKTLLSGLVDDELEPEVRHLAERHLAECTACRTRVDDMEALAQELASSMAESVEETALSVDFVGGVLARTVYAEAPPRRAPGFSAWLGWLAAAAAIAFAINIHFSNSEPSGEAIVQPASNGTRAPYNHTVLKSGIEAPEPEPEAEARAEEEPIVFGNFPIMDGHGYLPEVPFDPRSTPLVTPPTPASIRLADADALRSTLAVLDLLLAAQTDDFRDVEVVREIVVYDELLPRLANARQHLDATAAPALLAVESVLFRVANGPLSLEDARDLQLAISRAALSEQVTALLPTASPVM